MRIRTCRLKDMPVMAEIQQAAAEADGSDAMNASEFEAWIMDPELDALSNAFVITDDDDELNQWGQAGTLDGLDGEVVGYTVVQLHQDQQGYHFVCRGTVHPHFRRQRGGRVLLVGALNRARIVAAEFEFEAEQEGLPIYFEALLPQHDPGSPRLAERCEMRLTDEPAPQGMQLYRGEL